MFFQCPAANQSWVDCLNIRVSTGLKDIATTAGNWIIPIAAVGTLSMAVLQAIKNQTPIRNWYQRYRIRRWILAGIRGNYSQMWLARVRTDLRIRFSPEAKPRDREKKRLTVLERKLIMLCTSGDTEAFYDLPIDGLCDQIRKVISVILDNPTPYKDLLVLLARGSSAEDIRLLLNAQEPGSAVSLPTPSKDDAARKFRLFTAAKSRVLSQVRCSVDALQIAIGFRWKFWLQVASMVLSIVLGAVAFDLGAVKQPPGATDLVEKYWDDFCFGVLAGVLSPIARDLVAVVEKWRN